MNEAIFEKLGMSKGEIKVYLALSTLGESTIGPIVSESKVTKSKIYDILERLIDKGLAGHITKNGTKHFSANDPHMLLEYVDKQEEELKSTKEEIKSILPQLLQARNSAESSKQAEIFQGFQGIKTIRDELMNTFSEGEELLVLGAPKQANERMEAQLLEFHKKRIANKVGMKIIYNADAKAYGRVRKEMDLTKVKYFANDISSPNWIDIFPEAIMFAVVLDTPICFVVRDKTLAESFRNYFEMMWKIAEEE